MARRLGGNTSAAERPIELDVLRTSAAALITLRPPDEGRRSTMWWSEKTAIASWRTGGQMAHGVLVPFRLWQHNFAGYAEAQTAIRE